MSSGPLVSIVIPTYNRAGFVETAINSVLEQDYEQLELIVLDDGSSDETPELLARIAERHPGERFRWARHDNVGQAATINRGLEQARGELLGYLSSDDYLMPGAIAKLVAAIEQHPDADVVYPWFSMVDLADRVLDVTETLQHTFAGALRMGLCIPGVGVLVRRRLYEQVGGWNPAYRYTPDFEWWLRMGEARFLRVPEALGAWRVHDGSISTGGLGLEYLDERLRLLDETFARDDLSDEVRATRDEAYAAVFVHAAEALLSGSSDDVDRRYVVEDRLGPLFSARARGRQHRSQILVENALRSAEQQLHAANGRNAELQSTIDTLGATAALRDGEIAQLRAQLHELHANVAASQQPAAPAPRPDRPPLLRAARALVPPSLRPRIGAAVHRIRSRS